MGAWEWLVHNTDISSVGTAYAEEGEFGEKTQAATGSALGGMAGGWAGAEIGALRIKPYFWGGHKIRQYLINCVSFKISG